MAAVNSIRRQRKDGYSVTDIAKMNGVSRDTVYQYLKQEDFSPRPPLPAKPSVSKLDLYRPLIQPWLDDDSRHWRKQRHTGR